ncbi:flavodoxin domain-containing protein [Paraglaciecola aquimarina]|uniref:Flavodoxin domain-containing protein n=1 Tax=Paraglaciecola aquimarina TaxID=1235557 RepID=A0ABU3SZA8_9ALTE|nr:flavodoxin domain-containing protein [Paraglaciecola aquimarina]MDU0355325.1 flavodoxin domain-containing protein [Paraglaciecola aquimarina]
MQSLYVTVVAIVLWLVLCAVTWRIHRSRQSVEVKLNATVLIAYGSQTGNAQTIAKNCAQALHLPEKCVIALNNLTFEHLQQVEKALFVVSTYGDGEAPDNASLFIKHMQDKCLPYAKQKVRSLEQYALEHLEYSIIALGDSSYPDFCAFGFELNQVVAKTGAQLLGGVITVDNYEPHTTQLADITPT